MMARRPKSFPADLEPAWAAFWEAWPRRTGKAEAREAFSKAVTAGADPDFLARAAGREAEQYLRRGIDPIYIPYPSTWLNRRRWADDHLADPPSRPPPSPSQADGAPADPEPDHPLWPLLHGVMDRVAFDRWIGPCRAWRVTDVWVIEAPSAFHRDYLVQRCDAVLRQIRPYRVVVGT